MNIWKLVFELIDWCEIKDRQIDALCKFATNLIIENQKLEAQIKALKSASQMGNNTESN